MSNEEMRDRLGAYWGDVDRSLRGKLSRPGATMPVSRPRKWTHCPASVPWAAVETHDRQAMANHGQTLERLAERGGLAPCELHAVIHDRPWRANPLPQDELIAWVESLNHGADR